MRTIIAGSRSVTDLAEVEAAVRECGWWPTVVLSGRAPGADMLGEAWAGAHGIGVEPYPADWAAKPRTAGHTRNTLMAERADALVAVWDGSSPGTRDMIAKAQARGLRLHVRTVAGAAVPPPPVAPGALLAGARLPAGLSYATVLPDLDFETYSAAGHVWDAARKRWVPPPGAKTKGLNVVGAAAYSEHPSCEVLCLHYDLKDGKGRRGWRPGAPLPADLFDHIARGGLIEAWNVGFERWIWRNVCVARMGWPAVRPEQWRCAMAKSRAHAGPGKLEVFGEVFALATRKDADGKRLLDKFSMPRNPTKLDDRLRVLPVWDEGARLHALHHTTGWNFKETGPALDKRIAANVRAREKQIVEDHADALRLYSYNETDIASEAEASAITPDLSDDELAYWQDDQTINVRGVRIDLAGVEDCIAIIEQALKRYGDELEALAGCQPSELQQLKGWLHAQGVHLDSMDEDAVETALKGPLPDQARRALEIRAAVGSASVKKVYAMRNSATLAGRLHDLYTYHGARTGRPTGQGPQPTNLPKAGPLSYRCGFRLEGGKEEPLPEGGCGHFHGAHAMRCGWCGKATLRGPKDAREWNPGAMEDALVAIRSRSLGFVQWIWGDAMHSVAGVLRGLFVASEGHDFVSSDFTAIEGVDIACLAGEKWRIEAYANDEPMYLLSAERMFGVSVAEMKAYAKANGQHHPLRQKGKGGELGLGFGGWIAALRQFDVDGTDDELKDVVLKWRAASPAIEWFWGGQTKGAADGVRVNAGVLSHGDRWNRTPEFFGLEGMAVCAVLAPGTEYPVMRLDGTHSGVSYLVRDDVLYCRVPSGGLITYHRPRLAPSPQDWRGLSLTYEGWNSNQKKGPTGWMRMPLYGGLAAENVTQKVARDKQMGAIRRCEAAGYAVVMHTYDEIVAEVPEGVGSVGQLEALMTHPDPWNSGWPIKAAGGWRAKRYRKG
jgi:DNA polymerase bacteriophage-type